MLKSVRTSPVKIFVTGLVTGLTLQLAIGPVFLFIANLTLQKSFLDGVVGVFAVTAVDYLYITLAILGVGKLLEKKHVRKSFGIISSVILIAFGVLFIYGASTISAPTSTLSETPTLFSSFLSVFVLTITNPMTILFFTGLFSAKAVEYHYTKHQLLIFGLSVGLATFLFMGTAVILFSLLKESVPVPVIQTLNTLVGSLLIVYGLIRIKTSINKNA
ncbi:hypothetical protein CO174_04865 [Candidatus Uhrbacteria bacterium CG_4_9_14_3_um_filter_50_9]|uniref:Lysine transporter LysE n=1 Tax=Candidatus Uhrbacteria bacterium CG_4_9_14_3_um_filter_50_9 TaxID=1975035 RepID=A0A2M7XB88_9BACT|nr:MAG: hypothetical protein CO174_04865 [Candidatus Uhrbacteria bacterium CG_4_9_14_3_um_filter_50_9]